MKKTLLQLWKENPPGTRFRGIDWGYENYIIPCEELPDGFLRVLLHMPTQVGTVVDRSPANADWFEVYQGPAKPKQKVKRAQYLLTGEGALPVTTSNWFSTDEEVLEYWGSGWTIVARLEEREFDE